MTEVVARSDILDGMPGTILIRRITDQKRLAGLGRSAHFIHIHGPSKVRGQNEKNEQFGNGLTHVLNDRTHRRVGGLPPSAHPEGGIGPALGERRRDNAC